MESGLLFLWNKFGWRLHDKAENVGAETPPAENHGSKQTSLADREGGEKKSIRILPSSFLKKAGLEVGGRWMHR